MGKRRKRKTGRRRQGSKKRKEVTLQAKKPTEGSLDGFKAGSMTSTLIRGKR